MLFLLLDGRLCCHSKLYGRIPEIYGTITIVITYITEHINLNQYFNTLHVEYIFFVKYVVPILHKVRIQV